MFSIGSCLGQVSPLYAALLYVHGSTMAKYNSWIENIQAMYGKQL